LEERKKYIIWGVIGSLSLVFGIIIYNYIKNMPFFNRTVVLTAEFDEISTLKVGSVVQYNGILVGKVQDIYLNKNNRIMVDFDVIPTVQIPSDALAVAYVPNMLYAARLELRANKGNFSDFLKYGDVIQGKSESYISDVITQVDPYFHKVDSAIHKAYPDKESLKKALGGIMGSISSLQGGSSKLSNTLTKQKSDIIKLLGSLNKQSEAFQKREDSINLILSNLVKSTEKFKNQNIKDRLSKINFDSIKTPDLASGNQTIRKLTSKIETINQNQDSTLSWLLYDKKAKEKITNTISKTENTLEEIRLHPEKYVQINKPKKAKK
jgi:phospholipid/cholesterol/gamma-HCH transport system substrate-binding protein